MRRRAALSLIAACALSACAHESEPRAMAGMTWAYNLPGEAATEGLLAFGAPDSDNVLLMMRCVPHSAQVAVSISVPTGARNSALELRSDGKTSTYPAAPAAADDANAGALIEVSTAPDDPVLLEFAQTGDLTLTVNGQTTRLPPARQRDAADFFDSCR